MMKEKIIETYLDRQNEAYCRWKMLRPNGNNGRQKDSYRQEYLQARRELLSLIQQNKPSTEGSKDVEEIKLKWQRHNQEHGLSWNEVAELVNEVAKVRSETKPNDGMSAEEFIRSKLDDWNTSHLIDRLDPFYIDVLLLLMEQYSQYKKGEQNDGAKNFESELTLQLSQLPHEKHADDGLYNDGQIDGFELGARWAMEKYKKGDFRKVKCSERLPEKDGHYYVKVKHLGVDIYFWNTENETIQEYQKEYWLNTFEYWLEPI